MQLWPNFDESVRTYALSAIRIIAVFHLGVQGIGRAISVRESDSRCPHECSIDMKALQVLDTHGADEGQAMIADLSPDEQKFVSGLGQFQAAGTELVMTKRERNFPTEDFGERQCGGSRVENNGVAFMDMADGCFSNELLC